MLRVLKVCVTVTVCLTLAACGDSSDSGDAGKDSGLGVKRFAALDRVLVASVRFDKYAKQTQEDFSFETFREDSRRLLKLCDGLPEDDALMRVMRSSCPLLAEYLERTAASATCESSAACLRSTRNLRRSVEELLAVSRRIDRVLAAEKELSDECKQALTTPPQMYVVLDGYESAVALLERALRSPSPAALNRAQERFAAAGKESEALPSNKVLLERFRSGCG